MITIKRLKKKSKLPALVKKLQALDNQKVEVGYFADSGTHTLANMNYSTLAFIHAFPENGKHTPRNIFEPVKPMKGSRQDRLILSGIIKPYLCLDSRTTAEDVLSGIGRVWHQRVKDVFGNTALLMVTNNPTPLIDTSELKDNLGYRTTINYTLRYV